MFHRLTLMAGSQLAEAIASLRQQIASASANRDQARFNRRNSRSRQRDRSQSRDNGYCWYHRKFSDDAKRFTRPCTYSGNDQERR